MRRARPCLPVVLFAALVLAPAAAQAQASAPLAEQLQLRKQLHTARAAKRPAAEVARLQQAYENAVVGDMRTQCAGELREYAQAAGAGARNREAFALGYVLNYVDARLGMRAEGYDELFYFPYDRSFLENHLQGVQSESGAAWMQPEAVRAAFPLRICLTKARMRQVEAGGAQVALWPVRGADGSTRTLKEWMAEADARRDSWRAAKSYPGTPGTAFAAAGPASAPVAPTSGSAIAVAASAAVAAPAPSAPSAPVANSAPAPAVAAIDLPPQVASKRAINGMPPLFDSRPDPDRPGRHLSFAANGCALSFAQPAVRGLQWSGGCVDGRMHGAGNVLGVDYEKQPFFYYTGQIERGLRTQGTLYDFERRNGRFVGLRTVLSNGQAQPPAEMPFLDMPRPFLLAIDDWQRQISGENFLASLGATWAPGYRPPVAAQSASAPASSGGAPQAGYAGAPGSASAADCSSEIRELQMASQRWGGNANDVAARLGQMQKAMFQGRCSAHPEARAYIASAERMIGYGGNPSGASGAAPQPRAGASAGQSPSGTSGSAAKQKRTHVPEAMAHQCLRVGQDGGVSNGCAFAIEYSYCVFRPKPGSNSAAFNCEQQRFGSWQIGPHGRAIMHAAGERTYFFGCRYGASISKPDGISPADVRYEPNRGAVGRCSEWGAR